MRLCWTEAANVCTGTAVVPVAAVPTRRLPLQRSLGIILAGLGLFLFAGIVTIAGAAVREGVLPPGETPSRRRIWGARGAMAGSALIFGLLLLGGWTWWDGEDRGFRERNHFFVGPQMPEGRADRLGGHRLQPKTADRFFRAG